MLRVSERRAKLHGLDPANYLELHAVDSKAQDDLEALKTKFTLYIEQLEHNARRCIDDG